MSELTLTLLRLGYLALLWIVVLAVVGVLRRDLYGTLVTRRSRKAAGAAPGVRVPVAPMTGAVPVDPGAARSAPRPAEQRPLRPGLRVLVVTEGSLQGTTVSLGASPIMIGRSPECTLVLEDDYVSSRHARLWPEGEQWMVEDLGSTNGTVLDRERIDGPRPVRAGVPVRIGRTTLELRR